MKRFFAIINILGKFFHESGASEELADTLLDTIENFIQRTDNTIDDKLLLPAIKALRIAYQIPDNDQNEKIKA